MYRFDNEQKEIHFDKYNTPTPWMNYLSNGVFHTMISHCGGGVAFYKSPQIWRINHYRFFHLPTDRSGFYTYIRDGGEVWAPTNEPCAQSRRPGLLLMEWATPVLLRCGRGCMLQRLTLWANMRIA